MIETLIYEIAYCSNAKLNDRYIWFFSSFIWNGISQHFKCFINSLDAEKCTYIEFNGHLHA